MKPPAQGQASMRSTRRQPHAVVIGSGFGGLAAAVRLGARGYRVTVLEKCDTPGGRARVFKQDGFAFDAGPTIITAPALFEELWAMCGRKLSDDVDLRPVSPFYRIRFDDGQIFDYTGDADAMRAEIARFEPQDVAGYDRFLSTSREACRIGFEERGHVSFERWQTMAAMIPEMIGQQAYRSVASVVASHFRNERLRVVFSFHPLLIGGNPFSVSAIYCLVAWLERRWGVHFAMGGTGSLVTGLIGLIEGQGSELRVGAAVEEIIVEHGRATGVRLADGSHMHADIVVSNADSAWTYRHLIAPRHRKRWTDRKIDKARYSMSLFVWYFGTNRHYPDVAHHTILLGERYKALLADIFRHHTLSDDFSLYLHRPTATDPSLAPEGCDAFYVLSPVPHLDSGTDWRAETARYRGLIAAYLSASLLPGLEDAIISERVMTPQDFHDDLLAFKGAAFSFEPIITQTAYFRPHNKSEDIENLFLVGAGTHPGAGVPGVLSSARVLDEVVPHADAFV
jgi:phytoene desaturase